MAWTIEYTDTAKNQLKKLDKPMAQRIFDYMNERVQSSGDPRSAGKILIGTLGGLWRYRVGDYRVICSIEDSALRVLVIRLGHRRDIYRK